MPTFTATDTVTFSFTSTVDQPTANAVRNTALSDFARYKNLNVYTPGTQTVDPTLVVPALDAYFRGEIKAGIVAQRAADAAKAQAAIDNAALNP